MKKNLSVLLCCFWLTHGNACINQFYTVDKHGDLHLSGEGDFGPRFQMNFNKERQVKQLMKLKSLMDKAPSYMLVSDYATVLMKLGEYKEALEILKSLYMKYPEEYQIASNLGTAYELNGDPASALKYIKRGLELNPNDHEGSEWVHVKVLEAKLALEKDPLWLHKNTVLGLTEQQEMDSKVFRHIDIQVQERFPFSPGPNDPIMASLLTDLGDCYANRESIEYARAMYEMAREYYGDPSEEILEKIARIKTLTKKYSHISPDNSADKGLEEMGLKMRVNSHIRYKEMLNNNDKQHYQVKWLELEKDATVILALIGLTKTDNMENSASVAEKVSVKADSLSLADAPVSMAKDNTYTVPWYNWILTIVGATGIVWFMSRRLSSYRTANSTPEPE